MKLERLISFFSTNPSAKLVRSPHAAYIIYFLDQHFKVAGNLATPHSELQQHLGRYLEQLHETEPDVLRERAEAYLTQWSTGDTRWLGRYYDSRSAESLYQLTPHTEDVLRFLTEVLERTLGFVGTESRLARIIAALSDIVVRGSDDPDRRLKHLHAERDRIDREIQSIEAGDAVSTHSPTAVRERFADVVSDLISLQGDFRAVEESFKAITRDVQKQQTESTDTGVGLFRTEYLFLAHPDVPDEDEQVAAYQAVIAISPGDVFTIRTIDLGGDKTLSYLGDSGELNPFMGWRSIRLCFEYPEFFIGHIRAILRAAAGQDKRIRLLFPMVTTRDEMLRIGRIVRRARRQLAAENIEYGNVELGLMIEVPAAALALDTFLDIVDFVSIGSNDLVQYLTAADRDNPKVNHLCQPLSPAALRLLADVVKTCTASGKSVTLCGEMAASARAFPLLFGMGLRSYSMSPAFIPTIKELAHHLTEEHTKSLLQKALRMKTARQIIRLMDRELANLCPDLMVLETS